MRGKSYLKVLNYLVFYLTKILKFIGNITLIAILLTITLGIVSRYIFSKPFTWTEELATFLMVNLGYISGAIVTVAKKHIVADFLVQKAPQKLRTIVVFLSKFIAISVFMMIVLSSYRMFTSTSVYRSAALGLPRQIYYIPLFSMSAFMIFAIIVDILNEIFPGYNIQEMAIKKEEELAIKEELMEAKEVKEKIDVFLNDSQNAILKDKNNAG
jgi:TRAP-type C4-dicarboxylate transport system permease small subunit